jgi:hypothetical protein
VASGVSCGHRGRPLLAFPSQQGPAWQYEERGMIDAIGDSKGIRHELDVWGTASRTTGPRGGRRSRIISPVSYE